MARLWGAEWSRKTREVNRCHVNRAIARFGHVPLTKISTELLEQQQQLRLTEGGHNKRGRSHLSANSVKETFTLVKAALRRAKKCGYIGVDPRANIEVPAIKKKHRPVLQEEQLQLFLLRL